VPIIKSDTDLRNNYNALSSLCYTYDRVELYSLLRDGLDDVANGRTKPFSDAMNELISRRHSKDEV